MNKNKLYQDNTYTGYSATVPDNHKRNAKGIPETY